MTTPRQSTPRLAAALFAGTVMMAGCGSSSSDPAAATPATSLGAVPATTALPTTAQQTTAPTTTAEDLAVSVSVACTRGDSLDDLGIDLARVPFVDDEAPDDTSWVEIVAEVDNPTDQRVQVDPGFVVSYVDDAGTELAMRPWVDDTDPVYLGLVATDFVVGPGQTATTRSVVFDGYSGRLSFGGDYDLFVTSLDSCSITGGPVVTDEAPYEPPADVRLEISDCGPNEDGSLFTASLTATNDGTEPQRLNVAAEVLDADGDRIGRVGSNEIPVEVAPGAAETRVLEGAAWPVDNLSMVTDCRLDIAEPVTW